MGGFGEDDFVLHTSQSYIRASQPAISPNVAAGLSAAQPEQHEEEGELLQDDEEELGGPPLTTPSQNSKVCGFTACWSSCGTGASSSCMHVASVLCTLQLGCAVWAEAAEAEVHPAIG